MSREVRRVPANWRHPKGDMPYGKDRYIPLFEKIPSYSADEIEEGVRDGWLKNEPPFFGLDEDCMPQWPAEERTHYQMYETVSEGTPISPVMDSPESLARWLTDTNASASGGMGASYEGWLRICRGGYAPSMVITNGVMESGVEALKHQEIK